MIHVRQYVPMFVEGVVPEVVDVPDTNALLALPWVEARREGFDFYRFSESPYGSDVRLLMAEYKQGKRWWVVAYLEGDATTLPTWEPVE